MIFCGFVIMLLWWIKIVIVWFFENVILVCIYEIYYEIFMFINDFIVDILRSLVLNGSKCFY